MPARIPRAALLGLERLVLWLMGPRQAWTHVLFCWLALGWAGSIAANPALFRTGAYSAIGWAPNAAWMTAYLTLAAAHGAGLVLPGWRRVRAVLFLLSAWTWIVLAATLATANGLTPGVTTAVGIGVLAVVIALFVAWFTPAG